MQRLLFVDAVAEEVVRVGIPGQHARQQRAVGGQCLGELGGERGTAGAARSRTAAKRRPAGPATAPSVQISGRESASSEASVLAGLL